MKFKNNIYTYRFKDREEPILYSNFWVFSITIPIRFTCLEIILSWSPMNRQHAHLFRLMHSHSFEWNFIIWAFSFEISLCIIWFIISLFHTFVNYFADLKVKINGTQKVFHLDMRIWTISCLIAESIFSDWNKRKIGNYSI